MSEKILDISWETILKFFIASFIFYIIYLVRDIVVWFFFALIISILLQPAVNFLRKIYIPKIIAIFLVYLSEEKGVERVLILLCPQKYEELIITLFKRAQNKVAGWFGARILACLFVGVASFLVFYVFEIKYAFILALLSGILNFVPYVGPWITSILLIVFIIISSGSWLKVIYVLVAVVVIQEIENKLLTPILMKKMIDIPPVLVLVALLVGSQIFGFLGTIFAVPVFGIVYEFLKEFLEKRREGATQID
ncbi:MAG: AI-2E family transporter [Candidatus Staskawiczbacteria bacterium]|nr:AI-2E family transporter [Candidatus Staskawiczbacteria bacterium]